MSALDLTESDAELQTRELLKQGQWFLAYDAAKRGLERWPQNLKLRHIAARALISLNAPEEAEKILQPICATADLDAAQPDAAHAATDEETLGLLGRVYKTKWLESGSLNDARGVAGTHTCAFQTTAGHWTCVNAMTMSWIVAQLEARAGDAGRSRAELETTRQLAQSALEACDRQLVHAVQDERFWALCSRAEALLHLGRADEAVADFEEAARDTHERYEMLASPARQMHLLLEHGMSVPPRIMEILKPPTVIAYTGHMIDAPGRATPRFTPEMETEVRRRIDAVLEELDARIGYGSAASGADLLFIEALLDRNAEVHIVLPFAVEDFIRESVRPGGPQWEQRFRRVLERVGKSIIYATDEPYLDTIELYRFADQLVRSLAWQRARWMSALPTMVAVYDGHPQSGPAGTAATVAMWPDKERLRIIDPPGSNSAASSTAAPAAEISSSTPAKSSLPKGMSRGIKTLLFADVMHFSKLCEEQIPFFMYKFLQRAAELLGAPARSVETWGDGIFVVMDEALPLLRYAMALRDIDFGSLGLPVDMRVRIGLHAGPVFEGKNPMTGRTSYYGSHVNRAARIEPITLPGHIYASRSFVALLTDEQRRQPNQPMQFVSEYLGDIALAKNFGNIPVYRVRQRRREGI